MLKLLGEFIFGFLGGFL